MIVPQNLRKRINFQGEFDELLADVVASYALGEFVSFKAIEMGFEDLNLKLTTTKGQYFVKIFAESRSDDECLRLINMVKIAIDNGVSHPKFLKRERGYIFRERYEDFNIRLAVFDFIEGKTFYELKRNPATKELAQIIKEVAIISKIDYTPKELYDSWAFVNYSTELEKSRKHLDVKDLKILDNLNEEFGLVDIKALPHSLVHGDLVSTNIMKMDDKIYFVDFSVANYYPRIVELAVLMSDIMFDPKNKTAVKKYYQLLLCEYEKYIKLTELEKKTLPLFIKLAHAMHIVRATREKAEKKNTKESEYWINLGKKGLEYSLAAFK